MPSGGTSRPRQTRVVLPTKRRQQESGDALRGGSKADRSEAWEATGDGGKEQREPAQLSNGLQQCAICFESLDQVAKLSPCDCKVAFCTNCWDRALAQSFNACGQARCPTCRRPIRVDFDAEEDCIVFSREMEAPAASAREGVAGQATANPFRMRERLIEQARPVQIGILEQYSTENAEFQEAVARSKDASRGEGTALSAALQDLLHRSAARAPPRCFCGGSLERLSNSERIARAIGKHFLQDPGSSNAPVLEQIVEKFVSEGISICSCDLCGKSVAPSASVWTCESGNGTILHANAYDICEQCFIRFAAGCSGSGS